ncbi:MAG: TPM domain-containing protein, partial [Lutispora sp.]|nr:TPM domain-containing protein [Lutispora sp.]
MKRIAALFLAILSLTLIMLLPVQAAEFDLVSDGVGMLTDDEYFELNELAMDITEQFQCEVSIVIMDDKGSDDIEEYAKSFYKEYDYGYGEDKSGLMLFLSMEERDYA